MAFERGSEYTHPVNAQTGKSCSGPGLDGVRQKSNAFCERAAAGRGPSPEAEAEARKLASTAFMTSPRNQQNAEYDRAPRLLWPRAPGAAGV